MIAVNRGTTAGFDIPPRMATKMSSPKRQAGRRKAGKNSAGMEAAAPGDLALGVGKLELVPADPDPETATEVEFAAGPPLAGGRDHRHDLLVAGGRADPPEQLLDQAALQGRMQQAKGFAPEEGNRRAGRVRGPEFDHLRPMVLEQLGQQLLVLTQVGCGLEQGPADPRIILAFEQGQELMADAVADKAEIVVAGISAIANPLVSEIGQQFGLANPEQGPDQTARPQGHAGQGLAAAAPEQAEEELFDLIVGGMGHGQGVGAILTAELGKGPVAQLPGRVLQREFAGGRPTVDIDRNPGAVEPQPVGGRLDAGIATRTIG